MKRILAWILGVFLALTPLMALADTAGLRFRGSAITYRPQEGVILTVQAIRAQDRDISFAITDDRGGRYEGVLPKGKTEVQLLVESPAAENDSKTRYTLESGEDAVRRHPGVCAAIPRGAACFTFAEEVYQTYAGRQFTVKVRVENGGALAADTPVTLRDEEGRVLAEFVHQPNRSAYSVTFDADESWMPGKRLSVWVEGRDRPDDTTLAAVGQTGQKAIWGVERADSKIAFTMDCGSHNRYVPSILDILDEYGVKITFFVTGNFAAANPELVREMAARGHEIGNHSWNHPNFDDLKKEEIFTELTRTSDLLEALTGQPVTVFRPPYGHLGGQARSIVNALGMAAVRWTHESMDARAEASPENSLRYATQNMTGGSIILTHTSAACTLSVLPEILQFYRDNGFEVVKVSELLLGEGAVLDENGIQHPAQ